MQINIPYLNLFNYKVNQLTKNQCLLAPKCKLRMMINEVFYAKQIAVTNNCVEVTVTLQKLLHTLKCRKKADLTLLKSNQIMSMQLTG